MSLHRVSSPLILLAFVLPACEFNVPLSAPSRGFSPHGHPAANAARIAGGSAGKTEPLYAAGPAAPRPFQRQHETLPFLVHRIRHGSAAEVKAMLEEQDDVATARRGMKRIGDGILSAGVQDEKGRWLPSHECGGHGFVTAAAGQGIRLVLKNESVRRLEVVVAIDGADALAGGPFDFGNKGVLLQPQQTAVLGDGKKGGPRLRLSEGPAAAGPVMPSSIEPASGEIFLAVFHEAGHLPWERGPRDSRRAATRQFPQPRRPAESLPFEYR